MQIECVERTETPARVVLYNTFVGSEASHQDFIQHICLLCRYILGCQADTLVLLNVRLTS